MTPRHEDDEVDDVAEREMEGAFQPSYGLIAVVVALIFLLGYIIGQ